MQEKVSAQYKNEIEMAKSQRDYELKKAAYDVEVNTKKAESEMAYQLQVQSSFHGLIFEGHAVCTFFLEGFQAPVQILENILLFYSCRRLSSGSVWFSSSGGQDQAAYWGGEDAGAGGGAHTADYPAGAGDHPQGDGAGGQN